MAPVIDLYDVTTHQEEGSALWWYKRVDSSGNEIQLGEVSYIKVLYSGRDYRTNPEIQINGGGGIDAAAAGIISEGKIVAIIITNSGTGYTSAPEIVINGSGSGARAQAFISDGWHKGFARLKSDFEFGQDETPVYDEAKRLFSCKKNELKGILKFTSLQDDFLTENFLTKDVHKYNWAIFQNAGPSRDNYQKYRYFGIVRIPGLYRSIAPGRVPDMKGIILINKDSVSVNTEGLPVTGLKGNYNIPEGEGYSLQEELNL